MSNKASGDFDLVKAIEEIRRNKPREDEEKRQQKEKERKETLERRHQAFLKDARENGDLSDKSAEWAWKQVRILEEHIDQVYNLTRRF